MKWLKAKTFVLQRRPKNLWLKRKKQEEDDEYYQKRKEEFSQPKIKNPMKDNLFPFSGPYKSTFPFQDVYSETPGTGIKMDPEKSIDITRVTR